MSSTSGIRVPSFVRNTMPSLFGFDAMSLTMAPVASNGVAFGFGGAAALSDAGG